MGSLIASWYNTSTSSYVIGGLIGQTFPVPAGIDRIDAVKIPLYRVGSVGGNATVHLYATSGGVPTGASLGSASMSANSVATSFINWYTFTFGAPIAVVAGAKYAIVLDVATTGGSNYVSWGRSSTAGYGDGQGFYKYTAGSWTDWSRDFSFEAYGYLSALPPTVTTGSASSIAETSFTMAGNVTSDGGSAVTERGMVYSYTNPTPTTADGKTTTSGTTGAMSVAISGLLGGKTYYVRAYATNAMGTGYGSVVEVNTLTAVPDVTTSSISSVTERTAIGNGNVTNDHGATITERGVCWNTSATPTTANFKASASTGGTGAYSVNITGLNPNTLYYFRAYAINSQGTSYGVQLTATTKDIVGKWGQQFTASATGTLSKIRLYLKLNQGASATPIVKIYSDNTNVPNAVLATLICPTITNTAYAWVDIPASLAITSGVKYWIVIETPYVVGGYEIFWGANSAGTYGLLKYTLSSTPSTWTAQTDNATFEVYQQPSISINYDLKVKYKKKYL